MPLARLVLSTLSGKFAQWAPRTVPHTVITGFTVGVLSSFNIFFQKKISVSQCLLSAGGICMHFLLIPLSVFHRLFAASQIIRKRTYRSVSIWQSRTWVNSCFFSGLCSCVTQSLSCFLLHAVKLSAYHCQSSATACARCAFPNH